jgi:PAS domain-containing protein
MSWKEELESLLRGLDADKADRVRELFERQAAASGDRLASALRHDREDLYSSIFSLAGDSILMHTLDGVILDANKMDGLRSAGVFPDEHQGPPFQ